jgi:hypothetical protein
MTSQGVTGFWRKAGVGKESTILPHLVFLILSCTLCLAVIGCSQDVYLALPNTEICPLGHGL